jgi:serine/threonine protein kinase
MTQDEKTATTLKLCPICNAGNPANAAACHACGAPLNTGSQNGSTSLAQGVSNTTDALPAGTMLASGSYVVDRVLGQGGFGITYLCRDTRLDRVVAIKEFFPFGCLRQNHSVQPSRALTLPDYDSAKARFLQEARTLARFKHSSIVDVYTVFEENNTAYMVMEFLEGKSLTVLMQEHRGRLTEDEAVRYIEHVGNALQAVHEVGLLHRDLKPENVIACNDGRVMLIDFGTAKEYSANTTQGHTVVVTPGYAPLEQYAQRAQRGAYTDVYGLAATLYHLLTGEVPVAASDRAMGVELTPVRELNPQVSRKVARAVEAGLQIEISKRPQSVREFLDVLYGSAEDAGKDTDINQDKPLDEVFLNSWVGPSIDWGALIKARQELLYSADPQGQKPVNVVSPQPASPATRASSTSPAPSSRSLPATSYDPQMRSGSPLLTAFYVIFLILGSLVLFFFLIVSFNKGTNRPGVYNPTVPVHNPIAIQPPGTTGNRINPNVRPMPVDMQERVAAMRERMEMMRAVAERDSMARAEPRPFNRKADVITLLPERTFYTTFSPDGEIVAAVEYGPVMSRDLRSYAVKLWDVSKRRLLRTLSKGTGSITAIAFSPDNTMLATAGSDQTVNAWNVHTGKLQHTWRTAPFDCHNLAFSSDSNLLAGVSHRVQGTVTVWNVRTGEQKKVAIDAQKFITAIAFAPGGKTLVSGDLSGTVAWRDLQSGKLKTRRSLPGSRLTAKASPNSEPFPSLAPFLTPAISALAVSSEGSLLASHNRMGLVTLFGSNAMPIHTLQSPDRILMGGLPPRRLSFSPDGAILADTALPNIVRLWNTQSGQLIQLLEADQSSLLSAIAFSRDGMKLLAVDKKGNLLMWHRKKT